MCFPCLGGTGLPCPPLYVSSGKWLVFSLLHAGVWEGAGGYVVGGGGVGGGGLGGAGGGVVVWGLRPAIYLNRAYRVVMENQTSSISVMNTYPLGSLLRNHLREFWHWLLLIVRITI